MRDEELLHKLRELEVALHQPAVRGDGSRLDGLLHPEFAEFGRSGRSYTKAEILALLSQASSHTTVWSQDFALTRLGDSTALLTYKSASLRADGQLSRHAMRSSLWLLTESGWRLRFHQATPTEDFDRSFGVRETGRSYRLRPAAYVVVLDGQRRVACIAEASGLFLPGGGIEAGEDPVRAAHREVAEECARTLEIISPLEPAIQFFSTARGESYELHAAFFLGRFGSALGEAADQFRWFPTSPEPPSFFHECHRWAVQQALGKA